MDDPSPSPRRTLILVAAVVVAMAAVTGFVVLRPDGQRAAVAETAPPVASPAERAAQALAAQAAALLAGDEKEWLAAVSPGLRPRYRTLYRNLRGLDVSHLAYHVARIRPGTGPVRLTADLTYCFSTPACPPWRRDAKDGPPRLTQDLTLAPAGDRYVITEVRDPRRGHLRPTPWERAALTFARGERVTVAGPKSQARNLRRVLAVAEKAVATADRFARHLDNPQRRYRIYVADPKSWRTWYGGFDGDWAVGYAIPLHTTGTDVILRAADLGTDQQLRTTVKHELGHAVTLGGAGNRRFDADLWLSEGIAEYIGWYPAPARRSWNRFSVRAAYRSSKPPRTIVSRPIGRHSGDRAVNTFYAMGHFAADCLATRYGEAELFAFVRLTLRAGKTHDQAARAAFGEPFATVDQACVRWIRNQV